MVVYLRFSLNGHDASVFNYPIALETQRFRGSLTDRAGGGIHTTCQLKDFIMSCYKSGMWPVCMCVHVYVCVCSCVLLTQVSGSSVGLCCFTCLRECEQQLACKVQNTSTLYEFLHYDVLLIPCDRIRPHKQTIMTGSAQKSKKCEMNKKWMCLKGEDYTFQKQKAISAM